MMNPANICIFEGRMTREPQCSNVQMGTDPQTGQPQQVEKALFTVAVDRALSAAQRQKAKNGDQTIKTTDFVPCSLLGAQVATLKQYFPVGKAIRIMGHYTEYQTTDPQTGQKKYGHIFEVDNISFTIQDSKNLQNNGGQGQQQGGYQQAQQQPYQNNNGYQQPQSNYQQAAPQAQQNGNFSMFDEGDSPF